MRRTRLHLLWIATIVIAGAPAKAGDDARVTFEFQDVDVRKVVTVIAAYARANVVFGPDLTGTVTVRCQDVPWREALADALAKVGCSSVTEDGITRIVKGEAPEPKQAPALPGGNKLVTLDVQEMPLAEVVDLLREQTDTNVLLGPEAGPRKVTLSFSELPWTEALRKVVAKARCEMRVSENLIEIAKPPEVSFEFQDADLAKVLSLVAAYSGANLVFGPEVTGKVNVRLNRVGWRAALNAILRVHGFIAVEEDGILWVTTPERAVKSPAPKSPVDGMTGRITFDIEDRALDDVMLFVSSRTGVMIVVDPELESAKVTLSVKNLPCAKVLELLSRQAGFLIVREGVRHIRLARPPRVSVDMPNAKLGPILNVIAGFSGLHVRWAGELDTTLTVRFAGAVPRPALRAVVRAAGRTLVEIDEETFEVR